MCQTRTHFFLGFMLLWLCTQAPLEASPLFAKNCRGWLLKSLNLLQKKSIEPRRFDALKRRMVFVVAQQNQGPPERPKQFIRQVNEALEFLKRARWTNDQRKVLEFILSDDTLIVGVDLSNQSSMVSARLDRPLLVISANQLYDLKAWVHESAHWWILNEYPEITNLFKKNLEALEAGTHGETVRVLDAALRLWFEIKANDFIYSPQQSVLVSVGSYKALSGDVAKALGLQMPKSKTQAIAFRKRLRQEILNLIRWSVGVHLDAHHLEMFDEKQKSTVREPGL
jgi:hypothetical protein